MSEPYKSLIICLWIHHTLLRIAYCAPSTYTNIEIDAFVSLRTIQKISDSWPKNECVWMCPHVLMSHVLCQIPSLWNLSVIYTLHCQKDTVVAEETRKSVQAEEAKASEKAHFAGAIAADAQRDLDEALPALEAALASLKSLNKNDVTEVRHFDDDCARYHSNTIAFFLVYMQSITSWIFFFSIGTRHAATSPGGETGFWGDVHYEEHQTQKSTWREAWHQDRWLLGTR